MSSRLLPLLLPASIVAATCFGGGACAISDEPAIEDDGGFDGGGDDGIALGGAQADADGGGAGGGAESDGLPEPEEDPGGVTLACGDATGEPTFRFTSIKITEPQSLGGLLGGLMNTDIEEGVLNILIELRGLTPGGDTFSVLGGGGAICEGVDNAYTWDTVTPDARPSEPFEATLDGRNFSVGDDASVLYFPITLIGASVRLDRLRVSGTLADTEDAITDGVLAGYILKSTSDAISIAEALSLPEGTMLTGAMPENAVEDCAGEPCWKLSAEFGAALAAQHGPQ